MKQVKIPALVYFQNYTCYESIKEVGACGYGTMAEKANSELTTKEHWERAIADYAMRWIAFLGVVGIGKIFSTKRF